MNPDTLMLTRAFQPPRIVRVVRPGPRILPPAPHGHYLRLRHHLERAFVVLALPALAPLLLVIALIIKIESPGPVIYRQMRFGKNKRPFIILKFRSMYNTTSDSGPLHTGRNDSRITRVGRVLRLYRLDELPQLWNVLRGEMSLIGPRPEPSALTRSVEAQMPRFYLRRNVLPGITGLAQVTTGYWATLRELRTTLGYDLDYIRRASPWLDVQILLKTVMTVACRRGAR